MLALVPRSIVGVHPCGSVTQDRTTILCLPEVGGDEGTGLAWT